MTNCETSDALHTLQDAIEASPDARTSEQWATLFEAARAAQERRGEVVFDGHLWNEYTASMGRAAGGPSTLEWGSDQDDRAEAP